LPVVLIVASGISVIAGGFLSNVISEQHLNWVAGAGFIAIGVWTLVK